MAFVAGLGWRKQGWGDDNPVSEMLANFWIILQPLLFGLIGTEIRVIFCQTSIKQKGKLNMFHKFHYIFFCLKKCNKLSNHLKQQNLKFLTPTLINNELKPNSEHIFSFPDQLAKPVNDRHGSSGPHHRSDSADRRFVFGGFVRRHFNQGTTLRLAGMAAESDSSSCHRTSRTRQRQTAEFW